MKNKKIYITQPSLPPLEEFQKSLEAIWKSKWLTNIGHYHKELEKELIKYLGVKYISLFSNGTLALQTALQVLRITGEVITTPFSFVATTHALHWNGIKPVFCDIDSDTMTLDPEKIEAAITPQTTAILPVHVYGTPCNLEKIQHISDIYGLKVIYDAAHAFGVKINGDSVLNFGDLSVLSFHATKIFTTFEGGAIICHDEKIKKRIDYLKNFGFVDEETVIGPGINGKMNELQAAFGLLQLKYVEKYIKKRKAITNHYRKRFNSTDGIRYLKELPNVRHNYSYFPILINERAFGKSRDEINIELKEHEIYSRKYFYPLISHFPTYKGLKSAVPDNLQVAEKKAMEVLCLPIYPELDLSVVDRIVDIIIG